MAIRHPSARLVIDTVRTWTNHGILLTEEYAQLREAVVKLTTAHSSIPSATEQRFLTGPEVAEKLGISFSQFKQLLADRCFPFQKHIVGSRNVRYLLTEVLQYMEEASIEAKESQSGDPSEQEKAVSRVGRNCAAK